MPVVVISFTDGEVLHAETPPITFDLAVLEAELRSVDPNGERALFPVTSIRQIIVGDPEPAPPSAVVSEWDRAAFHFVDGDVVRASISPDVILGRHGGVWHIVEPDGLEIRTVGIPYASLKGVYHIRQWDSRSVARSDENGNLEQLARIMAEREQGTQGKPVQQRRALLSRMRRPRSSR